jgi:hypothetical protein
LAGQAREHAADLLAAAGRTGEARIQLGAAQEGYARLDAARADARLQAHGIRRGAYSPRRRPKSGWAALTETERKVAALLAEGLSNPDIAARMFTSRRTVQYQSPTSWPSSACPHGWNSPRWSPGGPAERRAASPPGPVAMNVGLVFKEQHQTHIHDTSLR